MSSPARSVCPICLAPIPASHETVGQDTYLVKTCPEHGAFRTIVWRGAPDHAAWARPKIPSRPKTPFTKREKGCPQDCGLCEGHGQHTCTAVLEVTWRCDLGCPVCFASSGKKAPADPTVEKIDFLLERVILASGHCNLQLSGGEPTARHDLPALVSLAKEKGFPFVQLNTNGIRLGTDRNYAQTLAQAGLDSVFLQFDGITDQSYMALRGRPLLEEKFAAVRNLAEAGIGIVLVPTVVPGVNDLGLGDILHYAAQNSPAVRGVHFQPVSYFGRYPEAPGDDQRITLPDVMRRLEEQTDGMVKVTDFLPPGCEHSHCSFHGNYLVSEDGSLQRLSAGGSCGCAPRPASEGADKAKSFVRQQWAPPADGFAIEQMAKKDDLDAFIARATSHKLAVSGMAFQDAWTLDLERLQGCCIHEVSPDGRLIPFCAYNLTAMNGEPLYRGKCHDNVEA
ncbi:radical SAM (seleno)protein TrsS [Pseudodesulfovibrio sediminis]|uniref:Radical SAM protein n=1 Tax=Pseudodesulfovibrio sediminis TaxID=2810563 RepID=A0ABM7P5D9_9BACT|nr:radical SAM (seleno)protein TrsS [Pseudodesulfovibrio sediminis]BCS88051.1 radical SAM protein [Pseudodesulfovibrio sediminis]